MNLAGLNLENGHMQAAVVRKAFPGRAPGRLHYEEAELPPEGAARTAAIKEVLLKLKRDYAIKGAIFGFPQSRFSYHELEMPAMKKEDLRAALRFELEKYLPLMPEEYSFDFAVTARDNKSLKLFLLATRTESMAWIGEALAGTGIELAGVRCAGVEMLNEFWREHGQNPRPVVLAYAAKDGCHLALATGLVPKGLRTVPSEMAQGELERLSKDGGVEVYLAGENRFNPALACKDLPVNLAYAIASSYNGRRRIRMDFSPAGAVPRDYYNKALYGLAGAALLLYFLTPAVSYYRDYSMEKGVKREIAALKSSASGLLDAKKQIEEIRRKKDFLLDYESKKNMPIKALAALSATLPDEAWLASVSIDEKGGVEIKGSAKNSALLIGPLDKSPYFKGVEFSSPVLVSGGLERFSIRMDFER